MGTAIEKLTIEGFKSIKSLKDFELRNLNILIGANGAGKSNFVDFFRLLREMIEQRLQLAIAKGGGADRHLFMGPKVTREIACKMTFDRATMEVVLEPTSDNRLVLASEMVTAPNRTSSRVPWSPTSEVSGLHESDIKNTLAVMGVDIPTWTVYHFHDTSETAFPRRQWTVRDYGMLRPDAANLAPFLLRSRLENKPTYDLIRDVVRIAAPFFDDFMLRPQESGKDDVVQLEWKQIGSDYPFHPSQLSDGTLRFVCLATTLLQPNPPSTIIIDEPELGLHPHALTILSSLIKQAVAKGTQVIVSTQSAMLLNDFEPSDIVVVDRDQGKSRFRRLTSEELTAWMEIDYSLGELWQKNVFGGGPVHE